MKRRRWLVCKYPPSLSDAAAAASRTVQSVSGVGGGGGGVQLTVWQIVDVLPQTQEVRVSQRSLGADPAPGVKLQQRQSTEG